MNEVIIIVVCCCVISIVLFIWLLFYLVGNIYNGLVLRKKKVINSWYEVNKLLYNVFSIAPELIKMKKVSEDVSLQLDEYFTTYMANENNCSSMAITILYLEFTNFINSLFEETISQKIVLTKSEEDIVEFYAAETRKIKFFIIFFNQNVENYNRFRTLPINIVMAKLFKFFPLESFGILESGSRK